MLGIPVYHLISDIRENVSVCFHMQIIVAIVLYIYIYIVSTHTLTIIYDVHKTRRAVQTVYEYTLCLTYAHTLKFTDGEKGINFNALRALITLR